MIKKLSVLLLGIIIAFASLIGNLNYVKAAGADDDYEPPVIKMENLIDNDSFSTFSDSYPVNPELWAGGLMDSKLSSDVAAGIISLKASSFAHKITDKNDPYKLASYFENEPIDESIISPHDKNSDKQNVLMISASSRTAYSYQAGPYDIKPNSYYKLSVYVYTPDFSTIGIDYNNGAFIAITGDITAVSDSINTYNTWKECSLFFSGYSYKTASIQVSLQLGDVSKDEDGEKRTRPASGYVFFDKVLLQPISYETYQFYKNNKGPNATFAKELIDNILPENFQGDFETGFDNWEFIPGSTASAQLYSAVYQPFGNQVIKFGINTSGYIGYRSQPIKIERHKFYHLAIWQFKKNIIQGSAVAKIVTYENGEYKTKGTLNTFSTNLGENSWLDKWYQGSVFIKGSSLMDKEIYVELWFGNNSAPASGVVYYDNISLEEILPEDFESNSDSGAAVVFNDSQGNPSVANGNFDTVGNYTEYKYPLPVGSWTVLSEKDKNTVTGIIRGDREHFEENSQLYGAPLYPYTADNPNTNLLMIANTKPAAYGYSVDVSVGAQTYKKISVVLQTQIRSGDGAELVLRKSDIVIAKHSKIDTQNQFRTYNFYVYAGDIDHNLTLEIWLGKEGGVNKEYYVSGHLFVEFVDAVNVDEAEYNDATGVLDKRYSFLHEKFKTFEESYGALKKPLNWTSINPFTNIKTVTAGILNLDEYDVSVLGVDKDKIGTDNLSPYAMVIYSPEPTAYGMRQAVGMMFDTEAYYRLTVRIKTVDVPKDKGARIILDTDKYYFENINTQYREFNYDNDFVDYMFFINVGTSIQSHYLEIWLGDNTKPNTLASGLIIVDQITIEKIDETAYNEGIAALSLEDEDLRPDNVKKVVLSETSTETPDEPDEDRKPFEWWLLPSIFFSILLIFCLIMIIVSDIAPKFKFSRKKSAVSYDRRATINTAINKQKAEKPKETPKEEIVEPEKPDVIITEEGKRLVRRKKYVPKEYKDEFDD
jgi:hypothetical protein